MSSSDEYKKRVAAAIGAYYSRVDSSDSFYSEQLEKRSHDIKPKQKKKSRGCPSEYEEHYRIAQMLRGSPRGINFLHPNNNARSAIAAKRARSLGMVAGASDIIVFTTPPSRPDKKGVCLEVKALDGRVAKVQREWLQGIVAEGFLGFIVWGCDAARVVLQELGYIEKEQSDGRAGSDREAKSLFQVESRRDHRFEEVQEASVVRGDDSG